MRAFDILANREGGGGLGLAVSGGSDSTALLVLAADWARGNGARIEVATVDHGLRPEAAEEAEAVAKLCERLGLRHATLRWKRERTGPAAQAEARRARHALLADWAHQASAPVIALGHTRDDRVETFLMRARQGSGWRGLAGPLPSGPSPVWPEGHGLRLIRPLLAFAREELRGELNGRSVGWMEDPSNEAERFERVRVRALMRRMDAAAAAQALRVMDALAAMRAAVATEARGALAVSNPEGDAARVRVELLLHLGREVRLRLLEALLMAAGGAELAPRAEALKRLCERVEHGGLGLSGGVTLGGAWIRRADGDIVVAQAPARRGEAVKAGPVWDRAAGLLGDPMLAALAV